MKGKTCSGPAVYRGRSRIKNTAGRGEEYFASHGWGRTHRLGPPDIQCSTLKDSSSGKRRYLILGTDRKRTRNCLKGNHDARRTGLVQDQSLDVSFCSHRSGKITKCLEKTVVIIHFSPNSTIKRRYGGEIRQKRTKANPPNRRTGSGISRGRSYSR